MRSRLVQISLWLFLGVILGAVSISGLAKPAEPPAPKHELTISAAISLQDVLNELARTYRAQKPEIELHFNLGASGTMQLQIEQGAPVDMFISASPKGMDLLDSKGLLVPGSRKNLVANRIVLIAPSGQTQISSFEDLAQPGVKLIAVGEPQSVPAGEYSREVLTYLGLYDRLQRKFVLAKDVRQVLTYVATGNVDAGLVYATDAQSSKKVRIVATAPEGSHSPVIYPVAILKSSKESREAADFEGFLLGPEARAVFEKYGFSSVQR